MKPKPNYTLTVTMTGRPPIRIRTEDWPVISYAGNDQDQWIVTRRCVNTGTVIVSAVNRSEDPERRAGFLVDPTGDIVEGIEDAAHEAGIGPDLVQDAIAELPAEEAETIDWAAFLEDMEAVAGTIQEDYPIRASIVQSWANAIRKVVKL